MREGPVSPPILSQVAMVDVVDAVEVAEAVDLVDNHPSLTSRPGAEPGADKRGLQTRSEQRSDRGAKAYQVARTARMGSAPARRGVAILDAPPLDAPPTLSTLRSRFMQTAQPESPPLPGF